jgi:hypothetical protein
LEVHDVGLADRDAISEVHDDRLEVRDVRLEVRDVG